MIWDPILYGRPRGGGDKENLRCHQLWDIDHRVSAEDRHAQELIALRELPKCSATAVATSAAAPTAAGAAVITAPLLPSTASLVPAAVAALCPIPIAFTMA